MMDVEFSNCPACESEMIEYWDELDQWLCNSCSFVFEEEATPYDDEYPIEKLGVENSEPVDWQDEITITDQSDVTLVEALTDLEYLVDELGLNDSVELRAAELTTDVWTDNIMHGRSRNDTLAAVIYIASRESDYAIPPGVIAQHMGTDKSNIKRLYKDIKKELNLDLNPTSPEEFLSYIGDCIGCTESEESTARQLIDEHHWTGNPVGVAAGAVYVAYNEGSNTVTLRTLSDIVDLTKETVWKHSSTIQAQCND